MNPVHDALNQSPLSTSRKSALIHGQSLAAPSSDLDPVGGRHLVALHVEPGEAGRRLSTDVDGELVGLVHLDRHSHHVGAVNVRLHCGQGRQAS